MVSAPTPVSGVTAIEDGNSSTNKLKCFAWGYVQSAHHLH